MKIIPMPIRGVVGRERVFAMSIWVAIMMTVRPRILQVVEEHAQMDQSLFRGFPCERDSPEVLFSSQQPLGAHLTLSVKRVPEPLLLDIGYDGSGVTFP